MKNKLYTEINTLSKKTKNLNLNIHNGFIHNELLPKYQTKIYKLFDEIGSDIYNYLDKDKFNKTVFTKTLKKKSSKYSKHSKHSKHSKKAFSMFNNPTFYYTMAIAWIIYFFVSFMEQNANRINQERIRERIERNRRDGERRDRYKKPSYSKRTL